MLRHHGRATALLTSVTDKPLDLRLGGGHRHSVCTDQTAEVYAARHKRETIVFNDQAVTDEN